MRRLTLALLLLLLACEHRPLEKKSGQANVSEALSAPVASGFKRADTPRKFQFPEDEGPHAGFQTEWWYYTGNLSASGGRQFGYQITFFKRLLSPAPGARSSRWFSPEIYFAHLALSDIQAQTFTAHQRFSRGGDIGLAGATQNEVWLEDWLVKRNDLGHYHLQAKASGFTLNLKLEPQKKPVLQGNKGLSQKSPQRGNASYYYSRPRLKTRGTIQVQNQAFLVDGLSWLDREWSTSALGKEQVGWDWFSLQFEDGRELMLYQMRLKNGKVDPTSSGTLIDADGSTLQLKSQDYQITALGSWTSPHTQTTYPQKWQVRIPKAGLEFQVVPLQSDQELRLDFTYWEGAVQVKGKGVSGQGYVELTGY